MYNLTYRKLYILEVTDIYSSKDGGYHGNFMVYW